MAAELGTAIRRTYQLAGVRQQDIAEAVGVSQSTISDWVNGRSEPSAAQIVALDEACGQPPGHIMREAGLLADSNVSDTTTLVREPRHEIADELIARLRADEATGHARLSPSDQQRLGRQLINRRLEQLAREQIAQGIAPPSSEDELALEQAIQDALSGLGLLQRLLEDNLVETIYVNGCNNVWITRTDGTTEQGPPVAESDDELIEMLRITAGRLATTERRFDNDSPILNLKLPDGSRLTAVMAVAERPYVTIRRPHFPRVFLDDLVRFGTIDLGLKEFLAAAVRARMNLLICGSARAGKTTLLRALLNEVSPAERLITIEDDPEIGLDRHLDLHPNVLALETREPNLKGDGEIALPTLMRLALRMNPDRVIVGEVRDREGVIPMLNAMSQRSSGSMCTMSATSSERALSKLAMYAMQSPERLTLEATNIMVAYAIDFVVCVGLSGATDDDGHRRYVSSVREVVGAEGPLVLSNEVFAPGDDGRAIPGAPLSAQTMEDLEHAGFDPNVLQRPEGW